MPLPSAVYDREAVLYRHSVAEHEEPPLLCSSPCGKYLALCSASGEPALLFDVAASSNGGGVEDGDDAAILSPPMRLGTSGSRILAAAWSGGSGAFAGAQHDGGIYVSTAYGLPARFIPPTESSLPAMAPLSLAFGPQGKALLALYPDGRVFTLPVEGSSASPPGPAAAAALVASAASAGSAACCMAVDADGKFLLLAGPGGAAAAAGDNDESSSVRATLWRFDQEEESPAPSPSSPFTVHKIAGIGKPRRRSWVPSFLGGSRPPKGWRAIFADLSCKNDDDEAATPRAPRAPPPLPLLLAAVAPGGQAPPSLFVASTVSLSKLELVPPSCVRDAGSAAWWGSDVVVISSSGSGSAASSSSPAVAALAPPSGACVLASSLSSSSSGNGIGSSSSCAGQLTPLMSRRSEHGMVQRVALLKKAEGSSFFVVAARERLPPAAAAAAAAAAGDWTTACSIAAAHPSGGWFARRADAVVHLPRWRAICLGGSDGSVPGGGATAEAAAACLTQLQSRKAAVAAALSAVASRGEVAVQRGLIDWALREISLHWPGGDDDDEDDTAAAAAAAAATDAKVGKSGNANDLADDDEEALALAASCSGYPPPPSSAGSSSSSSSSSPFSSSCWPSIRLLSHLWWASAKRAALRHAERLGTVSGPERPSFDRAAFAALRDADLAEVAAGVCAVGPPAAAAALGPLLRLHPRALLSVSPSSSPSTSSPPPALAALSSLPETTPVPEVIALLRLVVRASTEAAAAAGDSPSVDTCERAAVTAALAAAGASGSADLLPTESAIADDHKDKSGVPLSLALTDDQVAEWACARALAVDARTGQLASAAALLDAVATMLVDRAGGGGEGGGGRGGTRSREAVAAAERVAELAEAARELSSAAAAAAAAAAASRDASSEEEDEEGDEDGEDEGDGLSSSPPPRSPPSVLAAAAWSLPLAAFAAAPPLERARVLLLGGCGGGGNQWKSACSAAARERAASSLSRSLPSQEDRDEAAAALLLSFGEGSDKRKRKASQRSLLVAAAELAAAEAGDLRLFSSLERLAAACVSAVYSLGSSPSSGSSNDWWSPALALLHVVWRPLRAAEAERRRGERAEERRGRQEEREEKRRKKGGKPAAASAAASAAAFASASSVEEEEKKEAKEEEEEDTGDKDGWEDASITSAPRDEEEEEEEEEQDDEEEGDDDGDDGDFESSGNAVSSEEGDDDDYHFFDATPPPIPGSALSEIAKAAAACRAAALLRSRRLGGQLSSAAEIRDAARSSAAAKAASFVAAAVEALRGPPAAADSEWVEASADLEDVRAAFEAFRDEDDGEEEEGASPAPPPSSASVAAPLASGALNSRRWRAARTLLESLPPSLASSVALSAGVAHLRQATSLSDDAVAHAQQCLGLAPGGASDNGDDDVDDDEEAKSAQQRLSSARRALAALRRLSDFGVDVSSPASFLEPESGDRMEAIEAVIDGWPGAPREPEAVLRLAEDLGVVRAVPPYIVTQHASAADAAAEAAALDPRRVQVLIALGEAALRAGDTDAAAARAAEAAFAVSGRAAAAAAAAGRVKNKEGFEESAAFEHATTGAWRLAAAAADALLLHPLDDTGNTRRRSSRFLRAFALAFAPPGDALADLVLRWDEARGKTREGAGQGRGGESEARMLASRLRRAIEDPWRSSSPAAPLLVAPLSSRWPRCSTPAGRPLPSCGDAAEALGAALALGPREGAAALAELASAPAREGGEGDERFPSSSPPSPPSSPALPPAGARVAALLGALHAGLLLLSQEGDGKDVSSLLETPPLELWSLAAARCSSDAAAAKESDSTTLLLLSAGAAAEEAAAACSSDRALRAALPGVDAARWRSGGPRGKAYRASALAAGAAAAARAPPETRRAQPPPLERLVALAARTDAGEHRWSVVATYACELLVSLGEGSKGNKDGISAAVPPSADDPLVRAARDELRSLRRRCGERPAEWGRALLGAPWRALSAGNVPQMALWLSSAEDAERGKAKLVSAAAAAGLGTGTGGGGGGESSTSKTATATGTFATAATNESTLSFPPLLSSSPSAAADALASLRKALGLASRARPGLDTRALAAPAVEAALGVSAAAAAAAATAAAAAGPEEEEDGEEVDQRPSESLALSCGVDSPSGPPALSAAGVLFKAAIELAGEAAAAATQGQGDNDGEEEENAAVSALQDLARAVDSLPTSIFSSSSSSSSSSTMNGDAVRLAAVCRLLSLSIVAAAREEGEKQQQADSPSLVIFPDDAYDLAVAVAAGCSPASAAALARFALGGPPPQEVFVGFEEAAAAAAVAGNDAGGEEHAPLLWVPAALSSSAAPSGLPLHVRARAAADGEAALRGSIVEDGEEEGGGGGGSETALSLALAADELAAAGARARALCALRDGAARLGDDDVAVAAEAMDNGSATDALRALAARGTGFARLAAAARALGLSGPGSEFAAASAVLTSVLEAALSSSSSSSSSSADEDDSDEDSAASAVQGVMASLAAPAPAAPAGAQASARDAVWELLLSSSETGSSVAALEALSSLAAADAATPWRGWRPPATVSSSSSSSSSFSPSLELVRLAARSSAAVAKGRAAGNKGKRAGWSFSAADVASAESAAAAFHRLLSQSDSTSLASLGGLLADVWLDGRVFPPAAAAAAVDDAAITATAENGGANDDDNGNGGLLPAPPSSSAVPPLISSCYRYLLVEMLSRGDAPAALRVADAAAARGATLLPVNEDALAVCRSAVVAARAATEAAGDQEALALLLGASLGALLAPLEASAEQVAAAAVAGADEAASASAASSPSFPSPPPPPSSSSSSFDSTSAAASLVAALVARGSIVELSVIAHTLLETAFGRLLALALPEIKEDEGDEKEVEADWRACALPAAAACLASAGSAEAAAGIAAAHSGQSKLACGHLSACLTLLRAYLRALVLPQLCDPQWAPGLAARAATPAPAPGAVAAVWRGLPGAAVAALRVLDEAMG